MEQEYLRAVLFANELTRSVSVLLEVFLHISDLFQREIENEDPIIQYFLLLLIKRLSSQPFFEALGFELELFQRGRTYDIKE